MLRHELHAPPGPTVYPQADGQPMAENTVQFRWITMLQGNLDDMFRADPDVFVAGDLFWYPIEGDAKTRVAPDVMVVFGRPKGDRASYQQWLEGNIAPQAVMEVVSPSNTVVGAMEKFEFYRRHGVEELYFIDPEPNTVAIWLRKGDQFELVESPYGWMSPRLKVRFDLEGSELKLHRADERPFLTVPELFLREAEERKRADAERQRAEVEKQRADAEKQRAEAEKRRADAERQRAEAEKQRADHLAARLKALGASAE